MSEPIETTMPLDDRTALLLKFLVSEYVRKGGPAWECAQDWEEAFTPEELDRLGDALDQAVGQVLAAQPAP